jgi:hypothetical protein
MVVGTAKDEAEDYRDILIEMAEASGGGALARAASTSSSPGFVVTLGHRPDGLEWVRARDRSV